MNRVFFTTLVFAMAVVVATSPSLMAQKFEIHPYGGYYRPSGTSVGELKSEGIYGARLGFFLDPSFELEGNFGYLNHFEVKNIDPKSRGYLWELSGIYNFSERDWPLPARFTPNLAVGVGGITTGLDPAKYTFSTQTQVQLENGSQLDIVRPITMSDGDTFFTINVGGGIKSNRLWGPVGLRGDLRARILPNYYSTTPVWLEATGGINIVWGER